MPLRTASSLANPFWESLVSCRTHLVSLRLANFRLQQIHQSSSDPILQPFVYLLLLQSQVFLLAGISGLEAMQIEQKLERRRNQFDFTLVVQARATRIGLQEIGTLLESSHTYPRLVLMIEVTHSFIPRRRASSQTSFDLLPSPSITSLPRSRSAPSQLRSFTDYSAHDGELDFGAERVRSKTQLLIVQLRRSKNILNYSEASSSVQLSFLQ